MMPTILIVGAGPAGLMAACEAHRRGAHVILIDEALRPGGQIYRQPAPALGPAAIGLVTERQRKNTILETFASIANDIDYRPNTTAYAIYAGPEVHIAHGEQSEALRPDGLILAPGVSERAVPFPGWTLPGVLYAGGTQALLKAQYVKAGDDVVVAGTGPLPVVLAAQLVEAGARVHSVALLHPMRRMTRKPLSLLAGRAVVREGFEYLKILRRAGVNVLQEWMPLRAEGKERLECVKLVRHDGSGRPLSHSERRIECDLLAINFGFTANSELVSMADADLIYDPERGGWLPLVDRFCRTSVANIFAAGDGAGLGGAWAAAAEGRIAGAAAVQSAQNNALESLNRELAADFLQRDRHKKFQLAVRETLRLPPAVWSWADPDTIVCRCEGVCSDRLRQAMADGHVTLDSIKRNTRAGMGWCGGRTCLSAVAALIADGHPSSSIKAMTPRPLARPVSIAALAQHRAQSDVANTATSGKLAAQT
jgi:NADPH-dependent 2,4-dienoyl-CoA reductase/sulfur reductase-like enzyme/bacterioferritin-associated ferredoxin